MRKGCKKKYRKNYFAIFLFMQEYFKKVLSKLRKGSWMFIVQLRVCGGPIWENRKGRKKDFEKGWFQQAEYEIHIMHLDLIPKNRLTTKISLPKGSPKIAAYLNGWKNTRRCILVKLLFYQAKPKWFKNIIWISMTHSSRPMTKLKRTLNTCRLIAISCGN